jgi:hypothetical protein
MLVSGASDSPVNSRKSAGPGSNPMAGLDKRFYWKENRLYFRKRLSGYSIVADERHPWMWHVRRPDGSLVSDTVNRIRAKDAALAMLDRDLRAGDSLREAVSVA